MEPNAAADHLHVIRTLMERSALYRRTLAPLMLYVGSIGVVAAWGGVWLAIEAFRPFCGWWLGAAVVAVAGAFAIARRQPLEQGERFWSAPTLRVTQAVVPPLAAGLVLSLALVIAGGTEARWLFVFSNALFYGCAVHGAGLFMPRGVRLFGWLIVVLAAIGLFAVTFFEPDATARLDHLVMGGLFGVLHLAYAVYLYMTEPRKPAA